MKTLYIECDECGNLHVAEPDHESPTQGQIYAVVCDDGLFDYYTAERLVEPKTPLVHRCPRCYSAPWQPCVTPLGRLSKRSHAARARLVGLPKSDRYDAK